MYKRILLAYDGSEAGQKALLDCQDIAQLGQSALFLIAVMPPPTAYVGFEAGVYQSSPEELEQQQHQEHLHLERVAARLRNRVEALRVEP